MSQVDRFFKVVKFLSPKANPFYLIIKNTLVKFYRGICAAPADFKEYILNIYLDLFPNTTRELGKWESEFGNSENKTQTDENRKMDLSTIWKSTGGQSPGYIQDKLNEAGFNVKVHENNPPVNPAFIVNGRPNIVCFGDNAIAGNPLAIAGRTGGELLVNSPIFTLSPKYVMVCGSPNYCNNTKAVAGYFDEYNENLKTYELPTDITQWPAFIFIGGDATRNSSHELTAVDNADIEKGRGEDFKKLILTLKPAQIWVGLLINYI